MNRVPVYPGDPGIRVGGGDTALGWFHTVLWFVLAVLVILAILWVVRLLVEHASRRRPVGSPALAELEMRYARGEITREEYFTRRADLSSAVPLVPPATPPA